MHAALSPTRNRSRIFHSPRTHRLLLQKHTITLSNSGSPLRAIEQIALRILCRHAHAFRLLVGSIELPNLEGVPVGPFEEGGGVLGEGKAMVMLSPCDNGVASNRTL